MKKIFITGIFLLFLQAQSKAGDFIVEYVKENYKEMQMPASYTPVIYHSIQVTTDAGPKLLILKGDDYHYRKWLRQYIAQGKQFIAQIPDDRDDLFISSRAFEIDVTNVHPVNLSKFRQGEEENRDGKKSPARLSEPADTGMPDRETAAPQEHLPQEKNFKTRQAGLKQKSRDRKKQKLSQKRLSREKQNPAVKKSQEQLEPDQAQTRQTFFDRRRQEREKFLAARSEQWGQERLRRRQEMEKRRQVLNKRLLENERIRDKAFEERNREIMKRWLELQQRYGMD